MPPAELAPASAPPIARATSRSASGTSAPARRSLPNRLKRLLGPIANLIVYPLSGFFPRSRKRWAFGHIGGLFAGNPKYLYLWMRLHRPDLHVVWITGSERTLRMLEAHGHPAARRWSLKGIWSALRAGVFVTAHGLDNVNLQLSRRALYLNLWHGVGLKATQFGDTNGGVARARARAGGSRLRALLALDYLKSPDLVVTTSPFMQDHFAGQCELPRERCPQLGYPRLDCGADPALAKAVRALDLSSGFAFNADGFREVYIYLPTHRDTERPFLEEALPDLDRLSAALSRRDALLYLKLHPRTLEVMRLRHDNIRRWPEPIDFHAYLGDFTGLITDYSSVLYDYLFCRDAGVILYTFDIETYLRRDRALLYPFRENVAGLEVRSFEALCVALETGAAFDQALIAKAREIRGRFWSGSHAPASPAIVAHVDRLRR